jgi:hypothetical protein
MKNPSSQPWAGGCDCHAKPELFTPNEEPHDVTGIEDEEPALDSGVTTQAFSLYTSSR